MYRQGDVLLVPVGAIPAGARKGRRDRGRIVLAYGERTGHAHAIESKAVALLQRRGDRFVRVPAEGAALRHEEHGPIDLAPGSYRVVVQREYTPERVVRVAD